MDGSSLVNSLSLSPEKLIKSLTDDGYKCSVKFGANGKVTAIETVKVSPTTGLKLSDQPDVSVPKKVPLQQRKAEIAAEKDTVTVREKVFKKLKSARNYLQSKFQSKFPKAAESLKQFDASVSAKLKSSIRGIKKALKHENWEKIPADSIKGGSDQLKFEVQVHNNNIDQLERLENHEAEKQTELDKLKQVYKNTRKVCGDPESVIQSKKRMTVPIPEEGADPEEGAEPIIIESSDPMVRRGQVNEILERVNKSDFANKVNQLDSEIKKTRSEQKQLKASMKESGDRILELFKAGQHTLDQAEARDASLSKLQNDLREKSIELDARVEQLQPEIRILKNEMKGLKKFVAQQKKYLSELNKEIKLFTKIGPNDPNLINACNDRKADIEEVQRLIETSNDRLKEIPAEIKEKKAELDTKMKELDNLQKGKELKRHEKADKEEVAAEQNNLKQQLGKNLRKK